MSYALRSATVTNALCSTCTVYWQFNDVGAKLQGYERICQVGITLKLTLKILGIGA